MVGNRTTPGQNLIRSNIVRGQLSPDTKAMHPSHGRHFEIHMITNFKLQGPSSLVPISFLTTLSCLQMALNNTNLLSSFFDKIRPKISVVTNFNPVKWCSTFLAIQGFKWHHSNAFLITIVIRKLSQSQAFVPLFRKKIAQALNISSSI